MPRSSTASAQLRMSAISSGTTISSTWSNCYKTYSHDRPKIIVFESIYSMDGDVAPVREIVALAKRYNSLSYLDEVHAVGMYGPRGAGVAAELGIAEQVDIIQGTMAKAIGVIGGYIAASSVIIDAVRSFATGFIFTTSLPPAVTQAASRVSNTSRTVTQNGSDCTRIPPSCAARCWNRTSPSCPAHAPTSCRY